MKIIVKAAIAAAAFASVPAVAEVATANLDAAVANSAAMKAAAAQIKTQYGAQIAAADARETALQTELKPLVDELRRLQGNPATQALFTTKKAAYDAKLAAAQREIGALQVPYAKPLAYAQEQVQSKLDGAVRAAMATKNITLLVTPDAVLLATPPADLTQDIMTQLDAQVKTVSTTPPAGWQPGQAGAAGGAPAAVAPPAAKPTSGR